MIEYYSQEKSKTLVEIDKNLEKQEENRGQEMVNAEGKHVDIMDDLIRLEGELNQYIQDIDQIQEETTTLLNFQQQCSQEFLADLPKVVLELKKMK